MRIGKYWAAVSVLVLTLLTPLLYARQSDGSPKWINLPSAPLRIGPLGRGGIGPGYTLANYTNVGPVIRYRLGCVIQKDKKNVVVSQRDLREGFFPQLPPGKIVPSTLDMIGVSASHGFPEGPCEVGALSVVEAEFADGGVWKAAR
jgi:hypothetical protein